MSKKSTRFTVGDAVQLKRKIGAVPAGTAGVVVRVDDDGGLWVKINADEKRSERCVMTVDYLDNLEKIKETDGKNEELIGQLIDVCEDYITETRDNMPELSHDPENPTVFIQGSNYDALASRFKDVLKEWGLLPAPATASVKNMTDEELEEAFREKRRRDLKTQIETFIGMEFPEGDALNTALANIDNIVDWVERERANDLNRPSTIDTTDSRIIWDIIAEMKAGKE